MGFLRLPLKGKAVTDYWLHWLYFKAELVAVFFLALKPANCMITSFFPPRKDLQESTRMAGLCREIIEEGQQGSSSPIFSVPIPFPSISAAAGQKPGSLSLLCLQRSLCHHCLIKKIICKDYVLLLILQKKSHFKQSQIL